MGDFADWRETPKVAGSATDKMGARTPDTTFSGADVYWWNPTTWGNSYLATGAPGEPTEQLTSDEMQERDKGLGTYISDTGERLAEIFGSGPTELTPLERHAAWLEERPGSTEPTTIFGYPIEDVRRSVKENQEAGVSLDNIMDLRDRALMESLKGYYELNNDPRIQYEGAIGPPGPNSIEAFNYFNDPANRKGSGSGSRRPQYVAPDRRVIEEFVSDKMIVLTGARQPEFASIVDSYLSAAKQQFEGASIDPKAEVISRIRDLSEYKRIHTLRDEATEEDTWVGHRQQRLEQLGMASGDAASRGIALAATGATLADIQTDKVQTAKGRKDISLMNRLEQTAKTVGGLL